MENVCKICGENLAREYIDNCPECDNILCSTCECNCDMTKCYMCEIEFFIDEDRTWICEKCNGEFCYDCKCPYVPKNENYGKIRCIVCDDN